MFLTLDAFLAHFPPVTISREDFVKKFTVTYSDNPTLEQLFQLKSVVKMTDDPRYINREQIINYFYDVVVTNRHKYLKEFYNSYFAMPDPYELKWTPVDIRDKNGARALVAPDREFVAKCQIYQENSDDAKTSCEVLALFNQMIDKPLMGLSLQRNDLSRKIIRNLNYLDILHTTRVTNTCKSKTSFWQTLDNVYNHFILEDRFFAPSSIGLFLRNKTGDQLNYNNFYYLIQQYQPKASILNPYTINWILKNLFTGTRLLTPVMSWLSYLVAFLHSDWQHYVGIDVMPSICDRAKYLFHHYQTGTGNLPEMKRNQAKRLDMYCQPSESLLYDSSFLRRYDDYFDAIIMCPPYYDMEIYAEGKQSIDSFTDYHSWLQGYWEDTVAMCYMVLNRGGRFGFIINNYVSLKKDEYNLIQDLNMICLKYFKLVGAVNLLNRVSPLRMNHKKRTEMLFIYTK